MSERAQQLQAALEAAKDIVIIQADNPDGDSLASALALEQVLHELGKNPTLYCAVDIPKHLRYLPGWDRVDNDFPSTFDLSIIVDTSQATLLEKLLADNQHVGSRPSVIIDHHDIEPSLPFKTINIIDSNAAATGEMLYELSQQLNWPRSETVNELLAVSILYDSLGLMSEGTSALTIHIIGELVEAGVSLPKLDEQRRAMMKRPVEIVRYKGRLLERIEYVDNNRIAMVTIPWEEIEEYSDKYNPSMLVLEDMRLTEDVQLAVAFKVYRNRKITAKLRANHSAPVAAEIAEHFGGGGHLMAAGFKLPEAELEDVKHEFIEVAHKALDRLGS